MLKNMIRDYINNYDQLNKNIKLLPFQSAKHSVITSLYEFYVKYSELLRMLEHESWKNCGAMEHIGYYKDVQIALADAFSEIMKAENVEALSADITKLRNDVILPFNGFVALYERDFPTYFYFEKYRDFNSKEDIDKFFEECISQLNISRKELNAITIAGACKSEYIYSPRDVFLDTLLNVNKSFRNNEIHNYVLVNNSVLFTRLQLAQEDEEITVEKMICGNCDEVKTSTNFDVGLMGCQKLSDYFQLENEEKSEILVDSIAELRSKIAKGGLMFLLMPRIFLSVYALRAICSYLNNINVFIGGKNNAYVFIAGNRTTLREKNLKNLNEMLSKIALGENVRCPLDIKCAPMAEVRFRSSAPTEEEVEDVVASNNTLVNNFFKKAIKSVELKTEEETRHPLIPFGPGQLGLILVSGKIDGIVDEGDGNYHVIKGSARRKEFRTGFSEENQIRKVENTIATKVSVAMLTADGKYIELV